MIEREEINALLYRYALTRKWLLRRLHVLGELITGAELTGYLAGYRSGPKGDRIVALCLAELKKYGAIYEPTGD